MVEQDLLSTNPCWLGLISWLYCMCCVIIIKIIGPVTFHGTLGQADRLVVPRYFLLMGMTLTNL